MRTNIVLISLAVACLTLNSPVLATVWKVPLEYPTIQAAIDAAVNGDTVILAEGTYTGTGNKNLDFDGKAIEVRSIDPEDPCVVAETVIDCQNSGRGFYFHSGEGPNSIVSGLTIKRGEIFGYKARGGGIFCTGSSPTIENCVIRNNRANGNDGGLASSGYPAYGGGICCISGSHPRLFSCTISNNIAEGGEGGDSECGGMWLPAGDGGSAYGGGVYNSYDSQPRIENCTITNNIAMGGSGGDDVCAKGGDGGNGYGGGIFCGYGTISKCKIADNMVIGGSYGGGSNAYAGAGLGGGVYGQIIISNSIISGNYALRGYSGGVQVPLSGGGGICCTATSSIISCLITSNEATYFGTGIYVLYNGNQSIIKGCTIAGNTAIYYPAYAVDDRLNMYTVATTITDSIIWNHNDYDVSSVCSVTYSCLEQSVAGIGNIHSDPCFANPVAGDYHLKDGSLCIDAGDSNYVPYPGETDIDGELRVMGIRVDMGVDEFTSKPVPVINIPKSNFVFEANEGRLNPEDQFLMVSNAGGDILNWSITHDCNWLSVDPDQGTSTVETDEIKLSVDITGLVRGTYNCELLISDPNAANNPQTVSVDLRIVGPRFELSATEFVFTAIEGGVDPEDQVLDIINSGGGMLEWEIIEDCNWLSIEPNSGVSAGEPNEVILKVDIGGLSRGIYDCEFIISDPNAENSPQTAHVVSVIDRFDPNYPNLVSWWRFDEGLGTIAYDSAGDNDGTIYGATWTTDYNGIALDFDGVDDYISVAHDRVLNITGDITIAAWLYLTQGNRYQGIVSKCEGAGGQNRPFDFSTYNTTIPRLRFVRADSSDYELVYSDRDITLGEWHHVLIRVENKVPDFYVDADITGKSDDVIFTRTPTGNTNPLLIGNIHSDGAYYFNGSIDEVQLYNRALSAEEIRQVYYFRTCPDCLPLIVTSATEFRFFGEEDGPNPESQVMTIGITGGDTSNWKITENCEWLSAEPNSGFFTGETIEVSLSVDIGDLDWGQYSCQLFVSDPCASNSPVIVDVNLTVIGPIIQLSATEFEFCGFQDAGNPPAQMLSVSNSGGGTLNWEITPDCAWLSAVPNSGKCKSEVVDVNIIVDISGLGIGLHECELSVSDPNASNSPHTAVVTLYILDDCELHVPSEFVTIQAAVDMACSGCEVIVAPGIYTGPGNRDIDLKGKTITVRGINPNDPNVVAATVIDCEDSGRGFYFHSGEGPNSIVSGLSITNGYVTDYYGGGGILCIDTSPTIRSCNIIGNYVRGYYEMHYESRNGYGGGICCTGAGSPTIQDCFLANNQVEGGYGEYMQHPWGRYGFGGGIYSGPGSEPTIINCIISNNIATGGSGDSEVGGHGGHAYGGGICCGDSNNAVIINCQIISNQSNGGDSGRYGNGGDGIGGGIYSTEANIYNCTIVGNDAVGGTSFHDGYHGISMGGGVAGNETTSIINCILWANSALDGAQIYGSASISYSDVQDGWPGIGNIIADPRFVTGPLGDYYLSQIAAGQASNSTCVDAGSDYAANLGMHIYTTRTDEVGDKGVVDMGYHYFISPDSPDIDENFHIDCFDYSILAADWQKCNEESYLPGDITRDTCVNGKDLNVLVECWLDCYVTEATNSEPVNHAQLIDPNGILSWVPGEGALYHDVYFGTDANAVANAGHESPEFMGTFSEADFDPCGLELDTMYYWRVDEVGPACTIQGKVWNFTTYGEPDSHLVGWWKFDEGSGNIAYDSAGTNDGIIYGATWTIGQIDGALDFDGAGDYVLVSDSDSISVGNRDYTICAWFYPKSITSMMSVVSKVKDGADKEYCLLVNNGVLHLSVEKNSNNQFAQTTTSPVTVNSWQFVVVAFDSSSTTPTFYHNGQVQPSNNIIDTLPDSLSDDLYIGLLGGIYQSYPFDGMIDDVRIYDRVLTTGEIEQLYQNGLN